MPFIFASHLHDILFVRLLNAGLPWMASARGLADTEPVASVTHWLNVKLSAYAICQGRARGGTWVVRVWNGYGTVWNGVWNETAHSSTALPL